MSRPDSVVHFKHTESGDVLVNQAGDYFIQIAGESAGENPIGPAGGVLSGTYPNPTFAEDVATTAALAGAVSTYEAADDVLAGLISAEETARVAADNAIDGLISAEETARIAADNALDTRLDVVESAGSSAAPGILLDDYFDTDPRTNYTVTAVAGGAESLDYVAPSAGEEGYVLVTGNNKDLHIRRNDVPELDTVRNVLHAIEVRASNGGGTPILNLSLREQADRVLQVQVHGTNIHLYSDHPGAAGQLRANTALTWLNTERAWLIAGVFHDQYFGAWSLVPPNIADLLGAMAARASYGLQSIGGTPFADPYRTGKANRIRLATGTSDYANMRIYRHTVIDLDKAAIA